jgi:glycosyltransferase involved in cell wall biosynthesis
MRILVISNLYPPVAVGGYEARCAHTVQWLARSHDVLVLTSRHRRRGVAPDPRVLRELPFLAEGIRGTLRAPLAALHATRLLRRLVRRHDPDLVFVWNASQIPGAAIRAAQTWGKPVAFSIADPWLGAFVEGDQFLRHLVPGDRGARRGWALIVRLVNRLPALRIELATPHPVAIAWNSRALRRMTSIPAGISVALERVIHPATQNEKLFSSLERAPSTVPTVAFVGRLEHEKAPDVAYRAIALLRDRHSIDARLVLVGHRDADTRRQLDALAVELGIGDLLDIRGPLPPEGVARVLGEAHAILVPSRWQEPFGLVCLEAALARAPVVASMSGGMPEMLAAEEEALFFPIDDVDSCVAALVRTFTDEPATAARVGRALERAQSYSLERYRAAYDEFVEDVVGASRAASSSAALAQQLAQLPDV